jgi:predicted nucleic acid-binding protein
VTVVADKSVILNLCFLGQEPLLQRLFGTVHVPPQVPLEFLRLAAADPRFHGLVFPNFIQLTTPLTTAHAWSHSPVLHAGEIAALSLALELGADLVLMDEAEGRAVATALHLTTMGLLGILLQARQRGLIPAVAPLLDRLQQEARFWIAPSLRAAVLRAAGEASL